MSRIHPDTIYAALAGVAVGGAIGPLLFPTAAAIKTASLLSSIAAAGTLAYGEHSGAFSRARERYRIQRDSEREIFIQSAASREALALREIEVNELVETLVLLDELTPVEQRHFLGELGLMELLPIYQQPLPAAEPVQQTVDVPVVAKESEPEFSGTLEWAVQNVISQATQPTSATEAVVDDTFEEVDLGKAIAEMMVRGDVPLCILLACPPRTGKAQPLDAKILTPVGWRQMGDVKVGDLVIAGNGNPTKVIGVYPQGVKEVYRVVFNDGSFTECCDDHLWATQTRFDLSRKPEKRKGFTPKPLSEIRRTLQSGKSHKNHRIPMVGVVQFDPQDVPLDPYVLGALIGDGSFQQSQIRFTKGNKDLIQAVADRLPHDVTLRQVNEIDYRIVKSGSRNCRIKSSVFMAIDKLGLTGKKSFEKFVPDAYKFNIPEVRLGVLQGLLDTDGSIEPNRKNPQSGSCVTFSTTSHQLAKDVQFLVWSFGGKATIASRYTKYTYNGEKKTGRKSYRVTISLPSGIEPSQLASRLEMYRPNRRFLPTRIIDRVEPVGQKECQCIAVEDPSHLYVTDDFIVTHNTTLMTTTIAWLHRLTSGHVKLKIYNGKENIDHATGKLKDTFLGLVDDKTRYKPVETTQAGKEFAEEYHKAAETMLQPRQYPEVLFLDEFNNIRARVKDYDRINGLTRQHAQITQVDTDTGLFVTQGTSRKKFLFISSHSAYVMHIGIDRSYQDGVYGIVLGRGAALDGIYKALNGATAIVKNGVRAKQLLQELQEWENSPNRDHSKVVALTNLIDGSYNLYFSKYIDLSKVQFGTVVPSPPMPQEDPYAMWDEEFEDKTGHQPEDDPNWQPQPPEPQPKQPSRKELFDALATWINQLGKTPNDDELRNKAAELALVQPEALSNDALVGIKWILSQEYGINFDS